MCVCVCVCVNRSVVSLFATLRAVADHSPALECSRKEYWSGLPLSYPGDISDSDIEHEFSTLQTDYLSSEPSKILSEAKSLSRIQLFVTPWTVTYHEPLSMGFSRQEYWTGLSFPFPEDLPDPGIEPRFPAV